jgi:hypothetical protein
MIAIFTEITPKTTESAKKAEAYKEQLIIALESFSSLFDRFQSFLPRFLSNKVLYTREVADSV